MSDKIQIGDMVVHVYSNVIGEVIKQYYPTSCAQQTMVRTPDGRAYHAPTSEWRIYDGSDYAISCSNNTATSAAMPLIVKHDYHDIKIDASTTITVDIEELKSEIVRELYKDLYSGLNYLA